MMTHLIFSQSVPTVTYPKSKSRQLSQSNQHHNNLHITQTLTQKYFQTVEKQFAWLEQNTYQN